MLFKSSHLFLSWLSLFVLTECPSEEHLWTLLVQSPIDRHLGWFLVFFLIRWAQLWRFLSTVRITPGYLKVQLLGQKTIGQVIASVTFIAKFSQARVSTLPGAGGPLFPTSSAAVGGGRFFVFNLLDVQWPASCRYGHFPDHQWCWACCRLFGGLQNFFP